MALATLAEAKLYIGSPTSDDALIQALLDRASADIESYTMRQFAVSTYTEFFDGGDEELILEERPVISVTSVEDYADPNDVKIVDATHYAVYPEQGVITRTPQGLGALSTWAFGVRRWRVVYSAGFAIIPPEIVQATILLVSSYYNNRQGGNLQSESLGDYSYTLSSVAVQMGMPSTVKRILDRYRKTVF